MSKNLLILVDEEDQIIGHENRDKCHQGDGLLHRAFSIFIFNPQKKLLIQKRSAKKVLWPLHWSNSVCSHPNKGETCEEAAVRRLKEELGFDTSLNFVFKFQYQARYKNAGSEREMCSVYFGKSNGTVLTDHTEIAEWQYLDLEKVNKELQANPNLYTPWFKMEWETIQRHYRFDIENL